MSLWNQLIRGPVMHGHGHDEHHAGLSSEKAERESDGAPGDRRMTAGPQKSELVRGDGQERVLFVDPQSGIAGDMTSAALLDLGVPFGVFENAVIALGLPNVAISACSKYVGAIGTTKFGVHFDQAQPERTYSDIQRLLDAAMLPPAVLEKAQRIFRRLAEAEAEVHRIDIERVHFHEVGAVDAIVDIVCAAAAFEHLGAEVVCAPLPLGRGRINCRHGVIPLPAPATLLCLKGLPTYDSGLEYELVTPTGAAIIATLATSWERWPSFSPLSVGWGAGTQSLPDRPNALRVVLGERKQAQRALFPSATHCILECNVDDMVGELVAFVIERLLATGAADAWAVPVTMKKGRPGWVIGVLCRRAQETELGDLLLSESSSIGIRSTPVTRRELARHSLSVQTPFGPIDAKVSGQPGTCNYHAKPEFDSCRRAAEAAGVPLRLVTEAACRALYELGECEA